MKYHFLFLFLVFPISVYSQSASGSLQLHYDFRHSLDPERNAKNFPTLYFEYINGRDYGSFLLKIQNDFIGDKSNIGKFYIQVSQTLRFWEPKLFLNIEYSGGLGITEPGQYGYYINNAYSLGTAFQFQWSDAFFNAAVNYTYNTFKLPSHDILGSLYWWKGFWNYKIEFSGDIQLWTQNKNHGDDYTKSLSGKRLALYGEPQLWYNLYNKFSIGTKINLYYHVLTNENLFQVYPTLAIKYKL